MIYFLFHQRTTLSFGGADDGLCFDSATYKSYLYKHLVLLQSDNALHSNANIILEDRPKNAVGLTITSNDCLIIDELNYAPNDLNTILKKVKAANAYLIAIGRLFVKQFECSVDAIYSFRFCENEMGVEFKRTFSNVAQTSKCANLVTCEDSAPIATLYSSLLETDVIPAFGRSRFYSIIKNEHVALIIADKPKFGQDLLSLLYRLQNSSIDTLLLFCPECFEEILCEVCHADVTKYEISKFFDTELFFEEVATNISTWNKKKLAKSIEQLLMQQTHFEESGIMQNLKKFYDNEMVMQDKYCYEIHLDILDFARFSDDYLSNSRESRHGLDTENDSSSFSRQPKQMLLN